MDTQQDIFDRPDLSGTREFHDRRFAAFDRDNPRIWELFVRFTFQAMEAGFRHYSARAVAHRIRWHTTVEQRSPDEQFKLANVYVSRYARKFHREYPQHDGFFRTVEPR